MHKAVLIIDNRKEQLLKNKRSLESIGINVYIAANAEAAEKLLTDTEPDLVLISDNIDGKCEAIISRMRNFSHNLRPVIIVLSKSSHMQDRVTYLEAGADDFLSEPISSGEFKARIGAHLRRHFETETDTVTGMPNQKISFRVLKRMIYSENTFAAMLIGINNFEFYKEIYGELAADKMMQTVAAIAMNAVGDDFVGLTAEGEFLVLTDPIKAEIIARGLVNGFNKTAEKFYSDSDVKKGYITLYGNESPGKKISLVSVSIGIVSNEHKKFTGLKQILNSLISVKKIAERTAGSSYIYDRPKISAENSIDIKEYNASVLIAEPDESLSLLLETTAKLTGYDVKVMSSFELINFIPAVIILDIGDRLAFDGTELCRKFKKDERFAKSYIIMTSALHDKESVLNSGADLYIPKPYEIPFLFARAEEMIRKYND